MVRAADNVIMRQRVYDCPPSADDTADEYCRGKLSAEAQGVFEEHCATCGSCTDQVLATDGLIYALKIAERYAQVWRS